MRQASLLGRISDKTPETDCRSQKNLEQPAYLTQRKTLLQNSKAMTLSERRRSAIGIPFSRTKWTMAAAVRAATAIILVFVKASTVHALDCRNPIEGLADPRWLSLNASDADIEVLYSHPPSWIGVGHIFPVGDHVERKALGIVPWTAPTFSKRFKFAHSLSVVANQRPIFYIRGSRHGSNTLPFQTHDVHLIKLDVRNNERYLNTSNGKTSFTVKPGFRQISEEKGSITELSPSLFTFQPNRDLSDGEYLIILGSGDLSGYDFTISCRTK
jgi:hypothetical protein